MTGAILLTRLATRLGGKITGHVDAGARETDALVRSEACASTAMETWRSEHRGGLQREGINLPTVLETAESGTN